MKVSFFVFIITATVAIGEDIDLLKAHRANGSIQQGNNHFGGKFASISQYPWTATINKSGQQICSGVVVSATRILIAAHCTIEVTPSAITMRVATLDFKSSGQILFAEAIHNHPSYNTSDAENDISVIWLKSKMQLHSLHISILALPIQMDGVSTKEFPNVISTGWESCLGCGGNNNLLKFHELSVISNDRCDGYYKGGMKSSMFCAITQYRVKYENCQLDTGGPVADTKNNMLVGIVIWGHGCVQYNRPGVYTRIEYHRDWIDSLL